ncbi:ABC transporter ATP-binding protein [Microlunatus capsulatus]|uniref:Oligopeptide/dipeptide ABC transporter ATP-binding protein n=1 Tax=Microlunatus capsulatus TaxID=99117 RepID=A0ABS4Z2P1_9ACTN|nr:oligopeptide/dipeptide ABC transporter ATP-binding protein [Microlunatus capsulatus]MBP2415249.1 oligopeptide/dipeptide ABC transporter ATP-binding protein [Microlunatus capsulatus]
MSTAAVAAGTPLLQTVGLSKHYPLTRSTGAWLRREPAEVLKAVEGVELAVHPGRTLGVVGETGSGKSTLGRLILRLERPTSGQVLLDGHDIVEGGREGTRKLRREVQVVLQDPYTSLNPHQSVGDALGEALKVTGTTPREQRPARVAELLDQVGFPSAWADRRPGQLSGGGRQRVSIARALAVGPRLLVADEPVSALDVSVQAQVLNLFQRLQSELGLAYLFITHDLAVLERIADDVAVLYLGRVIESGPAAALFADPKHPYTRALLAAAPKLGQRRSTSSAVRGELPNPIAPPSGCPFNPRCPAATDVCRSVVPLTTTTPDGLRVACHLYPGSTPGSDAPLDGAAAVPSPLTGAASSPSPAPSTWRHS